MGSSTPFQVLFRNMSCSVNRSQNYPRAHTSRTPGCAECRGVEGEREDRKGINKMEALRREAHHLEADLEVRISLYIMVHEERGF